ncbi:hypothetical protein HBB16_04915 [Pseudonocardia sp. MCCB 268]|nr:hypothetical protein [Pseudonocardia cytotoxica]
MQKGVRASKKASSRDRLLRRPGPRKRRPGPARAAPWSPPRARRSGRPSSPAVGGFSPPDHGRWPDRRDGPRPSPQQRGTRTPERVGGPFVSLADGLRGLLPGRARPRHAVNRSPRSKYQAGPTITFEHRRNDSRIGAGSPPRGGRWCSTPAHRQPGRSRTELQERSPHPLPTHALNTDTGTGGQVDDS